MAENKDQEKIGHVVEVIGPVVDILFQEHHLPLIHNAVRITSEGFNVPEPLNIVEMCIRDSFYADAAAAKSALRDALEDPLHTVYGTGVIEVGLIVLYPPQLDLVGFKIRDKQRRIAGLGNQRCQGALGREMEISSGINDVRRTEEKKGIQVFLLHLFLYLLDLCLLYTSRCV